MTWLILECHQLRGTLSHTFWCSSRVSSCNCLKFSCTVRRDRSSSDMKGIIALGSLLSRLIIRTSLSAHLQSLANLPYALQIAFKIMQLLVLRCELIRGQGLQTYKSSETITSSASMAWPVGCFALDSCPKQCSGKPSTS